MVTSEKRTRTSVSQYVCASSCAPNPMNKPARMADTKIPVPVAASQFSVNTASSGLVGFSGVGVVTTGGVRTTTLCKPATLNLGAEMLLRNPFNCGTPQRNTKRLNNTHGAQARVMSDRVWADSTTCGSGMGIASPMLAPSEAGSDRSYAVALARFPSWEGPGVGSWPATEAMPPTRSSCAKLHLSPG